MLNKCVTDTATPNQAFTFRPGTPGKPGSPLRVQDVSIKKKSEKERKGKQ